MKLIQLTRGYNTMVDDGDYEFLNQWKWYANSTRSGFYAKRRRKLSDIGVKTTTIFMHRVIVGETKEGMVIDHIDGNPLNNQRSNLRVVTHSANIQNTRRRSDRTNKYRGTKRTENPNRWEAQIAIMGKRKHLGTFPTEEAAAIAYNQAAIKYFGDLAKLNIIE